MPSPSVSVCEGLKTNGQLSTGHVLAGNPGLANPSPSVSVYEALAMVGKLSQGSPLPSELPSAAPDSLAARIARYLPPGSAPLGHNGQNVDMNLSLIVWTHDSWSYRLSFPRS